MRVWNSANGELLTCINFQGGISSLSLHPTLPLIVYGQADGSMYIMEIVVSIMDRSLSLPGVTHQAALSHLAVQIATPGQKLAVPPRAVKFPAPAAVNPLKSTPS
jgi:hypothetical protein